MSPKTPVNPDVACHCGQAVPYASCCGLYHAGTPAPDAEALMRSRYCAYVLANADYLLRTWAPATRPTVLDLSQQPRWQGLKVVAHLPRGETAEVEFVARFRQGMKTGLMHEKSRFERVGGEWFYIDGVMI